MRIGTLIATLLLLATSATPSAWAHEGGPDDESAHDLVRAAAESLLESRFPEFAAHLSVRVTRLRATISNQGSVSVSLSTTDGVPRGHTQVRVVHETASGRTDAGWAVLYVAHFDSVLVAQRDIRADEPVESDDFATAWIDVTKFRGHPLDASWLREIAQGRSLLAATLLSAGDVLRSDDLRPPHAARTGETLTMTYRRGAVLMKLTCRAREPGAAGEVIRVYSDATKETYKARLGSNGTAEWVATL